MKSIKCVVVGDGSADKITLLVTFTTNKYPHEYKPSVFDNYAATVMIDGEPYTLGLFDTANQEHLDRLRPLTYAQADVFLVCFSVVNRTSFENIKKKWVPEIRLHCPEVPFILVGTQTDQREDPGEYDKCISEEEGLNLAKDLEAAKYLECSALTQKGVKDVFDSAVMVTLEHSPSEQPQASHKKGKCNIS